MTANDDTIKGSDLYILVRAGSAARLYRRV